MSENTIYWLWFTLKDDIKPKERIAVLEKYGNAKNVYNATDMDGIHNLSDSTFKALMDKSLDDAKNINLKTEKMGGYILTIEDEGYPPLLKNIYDPPYVLYCTGERIEWEKLLTVTIVGTRLHDVYGQRVTEKLAKELALSGATVVSGMARGIDSIAGITAIKSGGKTVAVLGSGLDVIYPPEHAELYNEIRKNGVVMTEYPPGTRPLRENFPRRNRIMAGLSYGILVTQAPEKSGALITASYAIENGRDLYAVPADIFNADSAGTNKLIKQGAKPVTTADDITNEYPYLEIIPLSEKRTEEKQRDKLKSLDLSALNDLQIKIVSELNNEPLHIDEISRITGVASFEINSELVMLELQGIVRKLNGNIYELI
ncbi:MAG: DNA-processing protein DprA [Clostridia bacterium]|nr:DNA-processing protein DprA [Clostridia bacterium]MBQ3124869.1 DNA-processing protein DprA [Clostridia bacterium]